MNHEWRYSAEETFFARNEYGDGPEVYHCPLCNERCNLTGRDEIVTGGCSAAVLTKDLPCTGKMDFSPRVDLLGRLNIALWLDDERPSPLGWVRVKTVEDAKRYLELRVVTIMSLDHDLGMTNEDDPLDEVAAPTGYDLVKWMAETNFWPKVKPTVHSANPVGTEYMRGVIDRYGPY